MREQLCHAINLAKSSNTSRPYISYAGMYNSTLMKILAKSVGHTPPGRGPGTRPPHKLEAVCYLGNGTRFQGGTRATNPPTLRGLISCARPILRERRTTPHSDRARPSNRCFQTWVSSRFHAPNQHFEAQHVPSSMLFGPSLPTRPSCSTRSCMCCTDDARAAVVLGRATVNTGAVV